MSIESLRMQRGAIKSKLTRFRNFIEVPENRSKIPEIRERLRKIENIDAKFETIQERIEATFLPDDLNSITIETMERDAFENDFFRLTSMAREIVDQNTTNRMAANQQLLNNNAAAPHEQHRSIVKQLPNITIPKFDGDLAKWIKFRDSFESMVHSQETLSNIDKFNYLNSVLEGEAARTIQSLGISDVNYEYAWNKLQERYEDPEELIEFHIRSICEMSSMNKRSVSDLRRIIDDVTNHLTALKSLGEAIHQCDSLLIYLIRKKLDDETRKRWDKYTPSIAGRRTWDNFVSILENHCKYLQKTTTDKYESLTHKSTRKIHERASAHAATTKNCPVCNGNHATYSCTTFKALSTSARIDKVKELKLCFNCLEAGHQGKDCNLGPCRRCHKRHNTMLHLEKLNADEKGDILPVNDKEIDQPRVLTAHLSQPATSYVLLGTALVEIQGRDGTSHKCRALLDSGSQVHFITEDLCNRLQVTKIRSDTRVMGIHQSSVNLKSRALISIKSVTTGFTTKLSCLITKKITDDLPSANMKKGNIIIPTGIKLADPEFNSRRPIDILIGASVFWDLLCVGQIKQASNQPIFQKTQLGWIVSGNMELASESMHTATCHTAIQMHLHEQIERFWKLEECSHLSGAPPLCPSDPCEKHFSTTTRINEAGRFEVTLPFNDQKEKLGNSYSIAYQRLLSIERKFKKDEALHKGYVKFMKEYEELNHMQLVNPNESSNKPAYYLPHHAVMKEQSTTTKLRVVFDGSAKPSMGVSINEAQYPGYEVQDELFNILIRFRNHKYVLTADAEKMYRQVIVRREDRRYQRILWRENSSSPVQIYELTTVTYGTRAGAFLAKRCLRQIGEENKVTSPTSSNIIINDFYVDDLLTGADTLESVKQIKHEVTQLLCSRGFQLRKWISNESKLFEDDIDVNKNIRVEREPKILGLRWNSTTDELNITVNFHEEYKISKRTILSKIAQIFDPLGLVAPIITCAKIIMQKLWQLNLEWDESLPQDLHTMWSDFQSCLGEINKITIPRRILCDSYSRLEMHGFCDASETAYGACIYMRTTNNQNEHTVQLLCAKSRVAPLKKISLPRLELCGAMLLAQLANKVKVALNKPIDEQYYWSDSMIVLAWIKAQPNRWKTFVANRVTEIQQLTNANWSHVRSSENPADLISRGVSPLHLINSTIWWRGPPWLAHDESQWPINEITTNIDVPEGKATTTTLTTIQVDDEIFHRYSSWNRLSRVIAYCIKFMYMTHPKLKTNEKSAITIEDIQRAQRLLIRMAQGQQFSGELNDLRGGRQLKKSSRIISLNPFLDNYGIMRVGGRISQASISYDQKHPIILPSNHRLSWLIIDNEHKQLLHAGREGVLASLRTRYWPLAARIMVKQVIKKCVRCIRWQGITNNYIMGNLPTARVNPSRPFLICGVDYAGPLTLREKSRSRVSIKAYVCIFVCFSTKAVHIELAHDMSTDAFLNCCRRFISRRGKCNQIYSDNGSNFVGAKNQLNELYQLLHDKKFQNQISNYATNEGMSWHMSPPRAPHFGGLWESAVKSMKFHLKRVIGETRLTYEEMSTILTQIEAILNSRPLYSMSDDPNDLQPLTPAHFLIGESMIALPEEDVKDVKLTRLNRYQHLQYMIQHFWQRWKQEYLHGLQQRYKWQVKKVNTVKTGTMVILKEDNLPPTRWKLGRIIEVHPGKDGIIRVATIRTSEGHVKRPIVKIVQLPIESQSDLEGSDESPNKIHHDKHYIN